MYKWLAYLGSTVELELALLGLKRYIEGNRVPINTEREATSIIVDYFGHTKAAKGAAAVEAQAFSRDIHVDIALKFGPRTTIIEALPYHGASINRLVKDTLKRVESYLGGTADLYQVAVVIFHKGELPDGFDGVKKSFVHAENGAARSVACVVVIRAG